MTSFKRTISLFIVLMIVLTSVVPVFAENDPNVSFDPINKFPMYEYGGYVFPSDSIDDPTVLVNPYSSSPYIPPWKQRNKSNALDPIAYRTYTNNVVYSQFLGDEIIDFFNPEEKNKSNILINNILDCGYPKLSGESYGVSDHELEWATAIAIKIASGNKIRTSNGSLVDFSLDLFNNENGEIIYTNNSKASEAESMKKLIQKLLNHTTDPQENNFNFQQGGNDVEHLDVSFPCLSTTLDTIDFKSEKIKITPTVPGTDFVFQLVDVDGRQNDTIAPYDVNIGVYKEGTDSPQFIFPANSLITLFSYNHSNFDINNYYFRIEGWVSTVDTIETYENGETLYNSKLYDPLQFKKNLSIEIKSPKYSFTYTDKNDSSKNFIVVDYPDHSDSEIDVTVKGVEPSPASLTVQKIDKDTGEKLSGVKFSLCNIKGYRYISDSSSASDNGILFLDIKTTDSEGQAVFSGLNPGTYYLQELEAVDGYSIILDDIKITVNDRGHVWYENMSHDADSNDETIIVENEKIGFDFYVVDSFSHSIRLDGATFYITGTNFEETVVSDSEGRVHVSEIPPGSYKIKQLSNKIGYTMDDSEHEFIISEESGLIFNDFLEASDDLPDECNLCVICEKTKLKIRALSTSNQYLRGAEICVYNDSFSASGTTADYGYVTFEGVPLGELKVKETIPVSGYSLPAQELTVFIRNDGKVIGDCVLISDRTRLTVTRLDKETNKPISGSKMRICSENGFDKTVETDENGEISLEKVPVGNYTAKEMSPHPGYTIDKKEYNFTVEPTGEISGTTTFKSERTKVILSRKDLATSEGLAGSVLVIYKVESFSAPIAGTTDKNGQFCVTGLVPGEYLVVERTAPTGYLPATQEILFSIDENGEVQGNTSISTNKIGEVSLSVLEENSNIPVAGVTVTVTNNSSGEIIKTAASNDNGIINIGQINTPGAYYVDVIGLPSGYKNFDNILWFFVDDSGETNGDFTISLSPLPPLSLTITNIDLIDETTPICGTKYRIYNDDGFSVSGTTDESGKLTVTNIPAGTIYVTEESPSPGYFRNPEVETLRINNNNSIIGSTLFYSEKTKITIKKVDKSTGSPIENVKFKILNSNKEVAAEATTNKNGFARVYGLPIGSYTYIETFAPSGYVVSNDVYSFEIGDQEVSGTFYVENEKALVIASITDNNSNPLPNASFSIYDSDNKKIIDCNSSDDGKVSVLGLGPGSYYLVEVSAPFGFAIEEDLNNKNNPKKYTFEIDSNGDIKDIVSVTNRKIIANIDFTDIDGNKVDGVEIDLFKENDIPCDTASLQAGNGTIQISNISAGVYSYKAKSCPDEYVLNKNKQTFSVDAFGNVSGDTCLVLENKSEEPSYQKGDINCDGSINVLDSQILTRYVNLIKTDPENKWLTKYAPMVTSPTKKQDSGETTFSHGDINCDGSINVLDSQILTRYVNLIKTDPENKWLTKYAPMVTCQVTIVSEN